MAAVVPWWFDGPFVALFPATVHSPRLDDLHDRERDEIHLRRRHRASGCRSVPHRPAPNAEFSSIPNLRSAKPIWTAPSSSSTAHADVLAILIDQPEMVPRWARLQWWLRYLARHIRQFNWRGRRATMSRIITISMVGSIPSSSMPTSNTAAPISRRRTPRSMTPSSPRSATCRQAVDPARRPRARHRLGLGWAWPLSG